MLRLFTVPFSPRALRLACALTLPRFAAGLGVKAVSLVKRTLLEARLLTLSPAKSNLKQ